MEKQYELGEIILVYGASNEMEQEQWQALLPKLKDVKRRDIKIKFVADKNITAADIASKAIYLVGTPANNSWLAKLQDQLPCEIQTDKFLFAANEYKSPSSVLHINLYPNPFDKLIPMYITTGLDLKNIQDQLLEKSNNDWRSLSWSSFGYQVFNNNICQLSGFFSTEDWSIDKKQHWQNIEEEKVSEQSEHFNFTLHQALEDEDALAKIIKHCEASFAKIQAFTKSTKNIDRIDYHIYADLEDKGMMLRNTNHGHIDFKRGEVHVIHHPAFANNLIAAENELILNRMLGEPKSKLLQRGLGIYLADGWQKKGWRHWAKLLHQNQDLPKLERLLPAEREEYESSIIYGAAKASFVAYLIDSWGKAKFLREYSSWTAEMADLAQLEAGWQAFLEALPAVSITPDNAPLPYLQGFNFAHEGYQIFNGYGSTLADQSMARMVNLGSNAVAIVPYSYMRQNDKPMPLPLIQRAGNETDAAVIQSIQQAKEKNCYVLIKPQIWLGKSWTGFVEMENEKDWDAFFDHYSHWIKHHALIAEIYEADALAVGVEFVQATLQNQDRWATLFKEIRKIYSGHLTYCANWGEEIEGLSFWEDLDYIGFNCYYPWSKNKKASKRELQKGLNGIIDKIEKIAAKHGKPVVFTEVGFRSVEYPWVNPHAAAEGRAFNENAQAQCYEALFKAIQNKSWCKGIIWWKWPTHPRRNGPTQTTFTPLGKKAEQVVQQYFQANKNQ